MTLTALDSIPILCKFKPQICFTGVSTYVFNPKSGKIATHIDLWDSISNNEYFSFEGFFDFLSQLLRYQPDDNQMVIKRLKELEIRRQQDGSLVAVRSFGAKATAELAAAAAEHASLIKSCEKLGFAISQGRADYKLCTDDRQSVPDILKRHEIQIEIDEPSFMFQWP